MLPLLPKSTQLILPRYLYPTGRSLEPTEESDVITMGTAERHILEFAYKYPGKYIFHPHQDYIAEHGCMGFFDVIAEDA